MTLAVLYGLIKALENKGSVNPWTISELLSLIKKDELDKPAREGLELAQKWIWEEFTSKSDPN